MEAERGRVMGEFGEEETREKKRERRERKQGREGEGTGEERGVGIVG